MSFEAIVDGKRMHVDQLVKLEDNPKRVIACPGCGAKLFVRAARSLSVPAQFVHYPDPKRGYCPLAVGGKPGKEPAPQPARSAAADALRQRAHSDPAYRARLQNTIKSCFNHCDEPTAAGFLTSALALADRDGIWSLVDLNQRNLPYLLMTLQHCQVKAYWLRGYLDKTQKDQVKFGVFFVDMKKQMQSQQTGNCINCGKRYCDSAFRTNTA